MREIPKKKRYEAGTSQLEHLLNYDLTLAEAVDYLAVEKGSTETSQWAAVRDIQSQAVSDNIASAREKINAARLNAEVIEQDEKVVVLIEGLDGDTHEVPFTKSMNVMGTDAESQLQLVYEAMGAIHGYYNDDQDNEVESALWLDGRPTNSLEEFDVFNEWGSPEAKADTILWSSTDR